MSSVCFPSVCSFISLSLSAVNLINNLLQVVVRRRFSVGKAMGHPWFQVCWLSSTINQIRYITGMFNLLKHQCLHLPSHFSALTGWTDEHCIIYAYLVHLSCCRTSRCGVTCGSLSSGWDIGISLMRRTMSTGDPMPWRKASVSQNI